MEEANKSQLVCAMEPSTPVQRPVPDSVAVPAQQPAPGFASVLAAIPARQPMSGTAAAPAQRPAPGSAPVSKDPCIRAENEDDDGYDPYSDRRPAPEPLFERDPWG